MGARAENIFLENKPKKDFEISSHISLPNRYVFVQVSKAASSSVKWALQSLEFQRTPWNVIDVNNKFFSPHISPYQVPEKQLDDVFFSEEYKRATFVRSPYTRILSCYLHRVVAKPRSATNAAVKRLTGGRGGEDVTFDEFVELICSQSAVNQEAHWRCQAEDLCVADISYDFVGKLESINGDLPELVELLHGKAGLEWFLESTKADASPMKTGSSKLLYEYYVDHGTVQRVKNRYADDFEAFGYARNVIGDV
uniref:sulfotransferase family 2 domain-containing protein n=1 Tax=uncultured Halomonas sp. TaxID=173971 RepID=UPI002608165F|nr:sulfotransferase family 2 domain-containing protein [uncultured Halomonas sp.]